MRQAAGAQLVVQDIGGLPHARGQRLNAAGVSAGDLVQRVVLIRVGIAKCHAKDSFLLRLLRSFTVALHSVMPVPAS